MRATVQQYGHRVTSMPRKRSVDVKHISQQLPLRAFLAAYRSYKCQRHYLCGVLAESLIPSHTSTDSLREELYVYIKLHVCETTTAVCARRFTLAQIFMMITPTSCTDTPHYDDETPTAFDVPYCARHSCVEIAKSYSLRTSST